MRVAIYDDVVFARGEAFNIPGMEVKVFENADNCDEAIAGSFDYIFMDYAMGDSHINGAAAIIAIRGRGFAGRIVAISSDPNANQEMIEAGANEALPKKAVLRSFLVHLSKGRK